MSIFELGSSGALPSGLQGVIEPFMNRKEPNPAASGWCNDSMDDSCCKNKGITDAGIAESQKWKTMISAAIAAFNLYSSLRNAKLQRDLGEKYLELAEDHRNYYNEHYKPLEKSLTEEAQALPIYQRDKEQLYASQMLMTVRGKHAANIADAMTCTGRYCTGQRAAIMTDQVLEQAAIESLTAGLGFRYTDREEINFNNLRWDKRDQVAKIGRDVPTEALSYASLAMGTFGRVGKQAGEAAEGAVGFLAYNNNRRDTRYPQRRGDINIPSYTYIPQKLEVPDVPKRPTFKLPEPPETKIKLSG